MLKNFIKLFVPLILTRNYLVLKFNNYFNVNKFNYEDNYYNRHAFILRSLCKFKINEVNYLEIGTDENQVFSTIPLKKGAKIGVDPLKGGTTRAKSDDFFKSNKIFFNVIFIDGLHTYDQTKKDCMNAMNCLKS